jgi:malonyl-CoA O-methyltransferase
MSRPAFHTDKTAIRAAFDRAASSYDGAAVLQREIADRLFDRLQPIRIQAGRILDAGAGTGYAGPLLRQHFPAARLIELDLAPAMLQVARERQRGGWSQRIGAFFKGSPCVQVCGDIEQLPLASNSVDLIWSSLAIQWCNEPDTAFKEFMRVLKPGGLLMFATLGPDTLKELRTAFAGVDTHNHVNQFVDMHDLGDALVRTGFASPVMDMTMLTLTYDDLRGVMRDLRDIGAHNHTVGRRPGLMGKKAWQTLQDRYEAFRCDGVLPASYEAVFGHAWKPEIAPRKLVDGSQVIEFRPRV